jgi:hypothetical protein
MSKGHAYVRGRQRWQCAVAARPAQGQDFWSEATAELFRQCVVSDR